MKKSIIKVLALSLVAVMMCLALVSCGAPNSDPEKAAKALKDNDYTVTTVENSGLGAIAMAVFTAAGIEDLECVVSGTNADGEHVTIFYFEDSKAANEEWEDVKAYFEDEEDDDSDWTIKKSGAMIYYGTSAGIKAAK